jgi:signal transduction histidine kinase
MQSLVVSILIVLPLLVEIARARRVRLLAQILVPAALAHVCLMAGVEMVLKSYEVRLAQADAQAYQEAVDQRWRTVEEALINGQPLGMGPISRGSCHVDDRECLADLRDSGVELQSGLSFASQMLQSGENVTLVAFRSDISHITWATFSSSWFFALEPSDSLLAQVYTRESEKPIYSTSRGHETLQLLSPAVYTDDHAVGVTPIKIAFRTTPTVWSLSTSLVLFLNLVGSLFVSGFVGFLHFAFTINERVEERAEKLSLELRSREAQIVNSAQLGQLGQMAAGIAHEINNPLAIISGRIDMILSRLQKDDIDRARLESDMHKISDTVARVAKIVKSLRVVSRNSEADPMVPVSVRQIFVAVDDLCRDRLARAGVEMRVGEIPNGVLLRGREVQLTQILLNLVGNGLDAVESQADRWIRIDFEVSKKRLIIRVVDSGTGIPEETLRRLMQPFFTTKAVGRGTGLGLSISRGIAQEHGGDLRYRLFQGHTAFELELPISEGQSLTSGKRAASF